MERPTDTRRRDFLKLAGLGVAAGGAGLYRPLSLAAAMHGGNPLAPRRSNHPARAKQLIVVFLTGGFSHVDTFDPKPQLAVDEWKSVSAVNLRGTETSPLLASPFRFTQHGQSGLPISELFPHLGGVADELCVIRSLHTDIIEHFQSVLAMHTGSATVPLPSLGAWLSYGLGTLNSNLPSYVVLCEHAPYGGSQVWDSNFLPPVHQGVRIYPGDRPIPDLNSSAPSLTLHELEQRMLRDANELHAAARPGDLNLAARQTSFDIARGMMRVAPEVFNLRRETRETLDLYGVREHDNKSFAWQCLVARRLIESGARTVEIIDTGSNNNWDAHGNMQDHRPKALRVDQPLAALITDLKRRGTLDDTLIAICTEFGRTPWTDKVGGKGRNHYAAAFTCLLAGAGVKGGTAYGQTDEHGVSIVANPVHVHDYHATILHLMGIDHEHLTYRYAGRDFRLTDVHGHVVRDVLT
jgi:uncharacterized protein (DUF1501 family)